LGGGKRARYCAELSGKVEERKEILNQTTLAIGGVKEGAGGKKFVLLKGFFRGTSVWARKKKKKKTRENSSIWTFPVVEKMVKKGA